MAMRETAASLYAMFIEDDGLIIAEKVIEKLQTWLNIYLNMYIHKHSGGSKGRGAQQARAP